jgi:hypothetical protein
MLWPVFEPRNTNNGINIPVSQMSPSARLMLMRVYAERKNSGTAGEAVLACNSDMNQPRPPELGAPLAPMHAISHQTKPAPATIAQSMMTARHDTPERSCPYAPEHFKSKEHLEQ